MARPKKDIEDNKVISDTRSSTSKVGLDNSTLGVVDSIEKSTEEDVVSSEASSEETHEVVQEINTDAVSEESLKAQLKAIEEEKLKKAEIISDNVPVHVLLRRDRENRPKNMNPLLAHARELIRKNRVSKSSIFNPIKY